jgi:hypothetical protein
MNKLQILGAAMVSLAALPVQAALIADFELNGDLTDSLGGPDIVANGGSIGATGYSFGPNEGLTYGGLSNFGVYTIDMRFSFSEVSGYRKIIDYKDRASDNGLYNFETELQFYPIVSSAPGAFAVDRLVDLRFTRDAAGNTQGFVNGVLLNAFVDSANDAVAADALNFFIDDFVVPGEAAGGFVDFIRIYDTASLVPEPASWAMMIAGFGLVSAAMRRRRAHGVTAN